MNILDTQVISYAFKGLYAEQIAQQGISSVTAKEFLLVQGTERTKANYYIPMPKPLTGLSNNTFALISKRDHPFRKNSTDQIILDFGNDHPPLIEFGHLAVAEAINLKDKRVFSASIQFLEKEQRKVIMDRFMFILGLDITCLPLNKSMVNLGLNLLHEFLLHYNAKDNFKNTINDIFILATAIDSSNSLITNDSLLNRFTSNHYKTPLVKHGTNVLIDFSQHRQSENIKSRESKGYVNKGWRVNVRNYRGAW